MDRSHLDAMFSGVFAYIACGLLKTQRGTESQNLFSQTDEIPTLT